MRNLDPVTSIMFVHYTRVGWNSLFIHAQLQLTSHSSPDASALIKFVHHLFSKAYIYIHYYTQKFYKSPSLAISFSLNSIPQIELFVVAMLFRVILGG